MKLHLVDDNGELYETIENVQEYDLTKPLPKAALMDEIVRAITSAKTFEERVDGKYKK